MTVSLDMSKATNTMTVWNSEIMSDKMNTTRICISEIKSKDRIGFIKLKGKVHDRTDTEGPQRE